VIMKVLRASPKVLTTSPKVLRTSLKVLTASLNVLAAAAMVLAVAPNVLFAQGRIANAKIETRAVAQPLEQEVQAIAARGGATWIGYRVPMTPGQRRMCCYDSIAPAADAGGSCRLESGGGITMTQGDLSQSRNASVVIEPASDAVILARLESRAVVRIRTFTPDCDVDAGNMPVVWLENVAPADSVAWLTTLARTAVDTIDRENHVARPAIAALALHTAPAVVGSLVALARDNQRSSVRSQALFWLGQRAGQEAAATITNAIANDPDTEVKRRAVFALSQLPKDQGIPLLINVARSNRNTEVRKQAMFWLGQSNDPRAVTFFEEILKTK